MNKNEQPYKCEHCGGVPMQEYLLCKKCWESYMGEKFTEAEKKKEDSQASQPTAQVPEAIQDIAGQLYQCAGAYDMPDSVLDVLSALAAGSIPENVQLLPMKSPQPTAQETGK